MNRALRSLAVACGFVFFASAALAQLTPADNLGAPSFIDYQGKVLDANGAVLNSSAATNYVIEFRLWNDQTAAVVANNLVWAESQVVTVDTDGTFSVKLGAGTTILNGSNDIGNVAHANLKLAFNGDARYLGVTVKINGNGTEIVPRLQFMSAPFAMLAQTAVVAQNVAQTTGTATMAQANISAATVNQATITSSTLTTANIATATITNATINGGTFTGNGAGLTSLNGANLTAGSVADSKLTSNVALLNNAQTFTGAKTFSGGIATTTGQAFSLSGIGSAAHGFNYFGPATGTTYAGVSLDGPALYGWQGGALGSSLNNTQNIALRWNASNNVGIGTASPNARLNVAGGNILVDQGRYFSCAEGDVFGTASPYSAANYGLTVGSDAVYLSGYNSLRLCSGGSERVRMLSNGYMGIGISTPICPLHVNGSVFSDYTNRSGYYFNATNALTHFGPGNTSIGIRCEASIETGGGFFAVSDARIKDVVGRSDRQGDLQSIQRLAVTDYRMKDRVAKGDDVHKGFIAQEVQKVYPEAVHTGRDVIPSIYAQPSSLDFDAAGKTLRVTMEKAHGLSAGETVRMLLENVSRDLVVKETPTDRIFVVGEVEAKPTGAFVYGKWVDDFLSVDYDRIFTAGIGAIQQLKIEKDAEVARLTKANEDLQQQVSELKEQDRQRENRVGALEKLLKEIASRQEPHAGEVKKAVFAQ